MIAKKKNAVSVSMINTKKKKTDAVNVNMINSEKKKTDVDARMSDGSRRMQEGGQSLQRNKQKGRNMPAVWKLIAKEDSKKKPQEERRIGFDTITALCTLRTGLQEEPDLPTSDRTPKEWLLISIIKP